MFKEAKCLYILEIKCFNKSKRIESIILDELGDKKINLKIPHDLCNQNGITVNFIKLLSDKEITKGFV